MPSCISRIDKLQVKFAVNTDASESEWAKLIEKTTREYFGLLKALCDRLQEMGQLIRIFM